MADGFPTNSYALNKISENLGLLSPSVRCISHAANGTTKWMVNSRSINVPEISKFLPPYQTICNFQISGKNLALLNEAMDVLEIKPLHLMIFCLTQMSYLVTTAAQSVNDVLVSAGINPEERYSLSPKSMIGMNLLVDVEAAFQQNYLIMLDEIRNWLSNIIR